MPTTSDWMNADATTVVAATAGNTDVIAAGGVLGHAAGLTRIASSVCAKSSASSRTSD